MASLKSLHNLHTFFNVVFRLGLAYGKEAVVAPLRKEALTSQHWAQFARENCTAASPATRWKIGGKMGLCLAINEFFYMM